MKDILASLRNPTHPLLKRLRQKAQGTYFHSLIVSELATSAALHFKKADPLLTQVGALYHDIGKMVTPEAYAENQEDRDYPFRPDVIITHVEKSIEMAKAYNLPESIWRFMATHHGTQYAPSNDAEDARSYPGSFRPQSIEETLVMLADSCEAAIRSSRKYDRKTFKSIIHSIFENKIENDQLRDSVLTVYDLEEIEEEFLNVFLAVHHRRHATEIHTD